MFILHISTVSVKCKRIDNFKKSDTLKERAFYFTLEKLLKIEIIAFGKGAASAMSASCQGSVDLSISKQSLDWRTQYVFYRYIRYRCKSSTRWPDFRHPLRCLRPSGRFQCLPPVQLCPCIFHPVGQIWGILPRHLSALRQRLRAEPRIR